MNEAPMRVLLDIAAAIYGFDSKDAVQVPGHAGGRNSVFLLDGSRVLRVSTLTDRTYEDHLAEAEYVRYLAANGAPVADVLPSASGSFSEIVSDGSRSYAVSMFRAAPGERIADRGYRYIDGAPIEEYMFNTGRVLGKIHALSVNYSPVHPRFDFFDKYNEEYFDRLIPDDLVCPAIGDRQIGRDVKQALHALLDKLRELPRDRAHYGMLHFDFNDGNYNIDYSNGDITVFDFDNCRTGWYMFDIASLWTNGTGWIAGNGDPEKRMRFMDGYMDTVLSGYRTETAVDDETLSALPVMIDAVRMENIIDCFETDPDAECDAEQAFNLKCLLENIPFMGFFCGLYDPGHPFELT